MKLQIQVTAWNGNFRKHIQREGAIEMPDELVDLILPEAFSKLANAITDKVVADYREGKTENDSDDE